jgi:hypothetical protein
VIARSTRLFVMVCALVALIAGLAVAQQLSPGPLHQGHAAVDNLNGCVRCHERGHRVEPSRCLSCHTALGARIAARAGFHATVAGQPCERCHVDHQGADASIIRWPGGAQSRFDHARGTAYPLRDAHAPLRCRQCHIPRYQTDPAVQRMPAAERGHTFLGLSRACVSCHADRHSPSLGTRCAQCHNETSWRAASQGFDHSRARFRLHGAHARVACDRCHTRTNTTEPPSFRGLIFGRCVDCHRDPHGAQMTERRACEGCHTESAWRDLTFDRATHAQGRFALSAAHATPPCARCHGPRLDRPVERACGACHDDAHRPSLGTRCEHCHDTTAWTHQTRAMAAPERAFHDRTAYPLRGAHVAVACDRCHNPRVSASRRFRPVAHDACRDCHRDPHQGELDARSDRGACASCHAVEGWRPVRYDAADHARTRFPLAGAHAAVACQSCHPSAPRSPGFRRADVACAGCHADVHAGQFFSAGRNPGGCVTCHAVDGWVPSGFDAAAHARTGFALTDAHNAACTRCHAAPAPREPVRFVGTPADCGACHRDTHAGQFAGRACASCHRDARFSPAPGFDHARTRFPLQGAHATTGCAGCHRPSPAPRRGRRRGVPPPGHRLRPLSREPPRRHRRQRLGPRARPGRQHPRLHPLPRRVGVGSGRHPWGLRSRPGPRAPRGRPRRRALRALPHGPPPHADHGAVQPLPRRPSPRSVGRLLRALPHPAHLDAGRHPARPRTHAAAPRRSARGARLRAVPRPHRPGRFP